MSDHIKEQILDRLLTQLEPLKTTDAVDRIDRRRSVESKQDAKKGVVVVAGDDNRINYDNQGPVFEFPLNLKLTLKGPVDRYGAMHEFAAVVVPLIETDPPANSLALSILPEGDVELTDEIASNVGKLVLVYSVQYRRKAGDARTSF